MVVAYANWVGRASSAPDPMGDAVVVHAGQDERLRHGLRLMSAGAAPTLVIMFGDSESESRDLCGRSEPYEVICPKPAEATTRGEAIALGRLAERRDWTTVVTVTSDYHVRRATYLDAKCTGLEVIGSAAGQGDTYREVVVRIGEEMLAMGQALLTSC